MTAIQKLYNQDKTLQSLRLHLIDCPDELRPILTEAVNRIQQLTLAAHNCKELAGDAKRFPDSANALLTGLIDTVDTVLSR